MTRGPERNCPIEGSTPPLNSQECEQMNILAKYRKFLRSVASGGFEE